MLRITIFLLLLVCTCAYALWRGGAPERITAAAMLGACIGSMLIRSDINHRFIDVEIGIFVIDLILMAVLLAVLLKADRGWPMLVGGLQLLTVGAHVVKLIDPEIIPVSYAVMLAAWSWPMVIALAAGTWRHQSRLRAQGYDLDWSLPLSTQVRSAT